MQQTIHDKPSAPDLRPDRPRFLIHMELTVPESIARAIERIVPDHETAIVWYPVGKELTP